MKELYLGFDNEFLMYILYIYIVTIIHLNKNHLSQHL